METELRPRGRRPGSSETREAIAVAARHLFADRGFDAVSVRAIATEAGVDPALVIYFFGSKRELFESLIQLPFDPTVVPALVAQGIDGLGLRVARYVIQQLRSEHRKDVLVGLLRAAGTDCTAAEVLRQRYLQYLLEPLAAAIEADRPELRAALCSSQLMGLAVARHVIGVPVLLETAPDTLVEIYGPTLQRYLTEPLPA